MEVPLPVKRELTALTVLFRAQVTLVRSVSGVNKLVLAKVLSRGQDSEAEWTLIEYEAWMRTRYVPFDVVARGIALAALGEGASESSLFHIIVVSIEKRRNRELLLETSDETQHLH